MPVRSPMRVKPPKWRAIRVRGRRVGRGGDAGRQLASRGSPDQADAALDQARALIEQAGTTTVAAHHAVTRAYCALCRGDPAKW